jgi:hypothetical protein
MYGPTYLYPAGVDRALERGEDIVLRQCHCGTISFFKPDEYLKAHRECEDCDARGRVIAYTHFGLLNSDYIELAAQQLNTKEEP